MFQFEGFDRRKQEDKVREEGRLPPGQSLTQKFPVLHYGPVPTFNPAAWDFRVWGEVEEEKRWSWDEFNQLPRTKLHMDIHCVTRWSKFDTDWEGVSVKTLVEQGFFKIKPTATHVMQHAEYGFTVNLPLEVVLQENFLLATHFQGEPISPDHGYPLRGVVGFIPGQEELETPYFWKGAKWLRSLEFMPRDKRGFWEQAGYHNRADVWREERFG
ncbi:MAG TPA: molybdopterin-dependent oxidoreductase [Anaerolineales bacterium]|nr:molybdopterin-dependent oxidoreductase [Anaerolineales bacterium]HNH27023.1 molybdopterin-dependent oxidoreductase [Anaerolineales bacterium]HNM35707.1 molybdopterin-dependent oxidoreductase [Anaerolineales bacterium]HNO93606.1 molybdopterin-dependent oxidoreductase [Anaerolineales bacterium]